MTPATIFNITFGADVFTLGCLRRADEGLDPAERPHERFRPWLFIEERPDLFHVVTCSTFTDDLISRSLGSGDVVLDIACGSGEGTAQLASRCGRIVGCDLDAGVVQEARARGIGNAAFEVQDGCALTYPDGAFSVIVSSNTLETCG